MNPKKHERPNEDEYIKHISVLSETVNTHLEKGLMENICVAPDTLLHLCEAYYEYKKLTQQK